MAATLRAILKLERLNVKKRAYLLYAAIKPLAPFAGKGPRRRPKRRVVRPTEIVPLGIDTDERTT